VKEWPSQRLHGLVQGHPQGIAGVIGRSQTCCHGRIGSSPFADLPTRREATRFAVASRGLITVRQYPQLHRNRFPGKSR